MNTNSIDFFMGTGKLLFFKKDVYIMLFASFYIELFKSLGKKAFTNLKALTYSCSEDLTEVAEVFSVLILLLFPFQNLMMYQSPGEGCCCFRCF